jgi:glucose-fructose oxidoreductase
MDMTVTVKGRTRERTFPKQDQFAPELLYFSDCVLDRREPQPSGREGLADVRIIEALYASARSGKRIRLEDFDPGKRPKPDQLIERPGVKKPALVNAEPPSGES